MTLRYLLDTNVISEPLRPAPHPVVLARLQQHARASPGGLAHLKE
jgi:tRNA(fMet)-specific endonuclease VapC